MTKISIDKSNYAILKPTPWDARAFGLKTGEIHFSPNISEEDVASLLDQLESAISSESYELVYTRIDSQERMLRHHIQDRGFRYVETTLTLNKRRLHKLKFPDKLFDIRSYTPSDIEAIKDIAVTAFDYGRFYEDIMVSPEINHKRHWHWIDDLVEQGKEIIVYESDNQLISFMALEIMGSKAKLILGGSRRDFGLVSPYFWSSLLNYLVSQGVRNVVDVKVSAANIATINLYLSYGFNISNSSFGFHKYIK